MKTPPFSLNLTSKRIYKRFFFLFILIGFFGSEPFFYPADSALDSSWVWSLGYAAEHHLQWGIDYIFTYGPLGYLDFPYLHDSYWIGLLSILCYNGTKILTVYSIYILAYRGNRSPNIVEYLYLLMLVVLFRTQASEGCLVVCAIANIACVWKYGIQLRYLILAGFYFALGSMIKGTAFIESCGTIVCYLIAHYALYGFNLRVWKTFILPLTFPASYFISFLVLWMLSGQELVHLPRYLGVLFHVVTGYAAAMGDVGDYFQFLWGLFFGLVLIGLYSTSVYLNLKPQMGLAISCASVLFLSYKEGFTRCDAGMYSAHSDIVFEIIAVLAFFHYLLTKVQSMKLGGAFLILSMSCYLFMCFELPGVLPRIDYQAAFGNIENLVNLSDPAVYKDTTDKSFAALQDSYKLPPQIVSSLKQVDTLIVPIDLQINAAYKLPVILAPVPQQYNAYDDYLDHKNSSWLKNRKPEQIILAFQPLDDRYMFSDSPSFNLSLLRQYAIAARDDRYALLERKTTDASPIDWSKSVPAKHQLNEWISIPISDGLVLSKIKLSRSFAGALWGLFYKNAEVHITFKLADGTLTDPYRFILANGGSGGLASPCIRNVAELDQAMHGKGTRVSAVRLTVEPGCAWQYSAEFESEFITTDLN